MLCIEKTDRFARWLDQLRDRAAAALIVARLFRFQEGHRGDVKSVGGGVNELRIDRGPGYRIYYTRTDASVVLLLCGGDKATQWADIEIARKMVQQRRRSNK